MYSSEPVSTWTDVSAARQYAVVEQAIHYLRQHARRQPTLAEVAQAVHLSEHHLQRVFAAWAGVSPKRFLQFLTKEYAYAALRESRDVLSVSLDSGLSSPGRLHDLMVSCEAMTPGEIRLRGAGLQMSWGCGETPFGLGLVAWTSRGICHLAFVGTSPEVAADTMRAQWPEALWQQEDEAAQRLLAQVFPSAPQAGRLHLLLRGTNFQIKVWEALLRLPVGQRVSYTQLATMAGLPRAQRAVGSALAANTIGYLIPCHRVIRESGESGHYRWGDERKVAMLAWEAAASTPSGP
jgi:AraC family transcriptional regulator of adaptative response/methylated-DNA-[protein]-cysteine methyltransferase